MTDPLTEYRLKAERPKSPQVEPDASYWFRCPVLSILSFDDIKDEVDKVVEPYPMDRATQDKEIAELKDFFARREQSFTQDEQDKLSLFLKHPKFTERPPIGAVVSKRPNFSPLIENGKELATLFEGETPGLWYRHVLNVLLDPTTPNGLGQQLSPPLQALIWSALDVAIASALMAAWHYKWLATDLNGVARRERPFEFAERVREPFDVLFDLQVTFNGPIIERKDPKPTPPSTPGTPRHPAYPSGHSTYSAAASTVLKCLFPKSEALKIDDLRPEFDKLATNTGEARLWGGVHWRSDHDTAQKIGKAVGDLVIEQLKQTGIYQLLGAEFDLEPLERTRLESKAEEFAGKCDDEKGSENDFCQGLPKGGIEVFQNLQTF